MKKMVGFGNRDKVEQARQAREIHSGVDPDEGINVFRGARNALLIILLTAALVVAIIASVHGQDMEVVDGKHSALLQEGSWIESFEVAGAIVKSDCTYLPDSTFKSIVTIEFPESEIVSTLSGSWIVMAGDLITEIQASSNHRFFPPGLTTAATILTITESKAIFRLDNGKGFQSHNSLYANRVWGENDY